MDPLGVAVIVAVLIVATTFGLWRRRTDGIIRDEAAEKKRRRDIFHAAGLEIVELPDHSSPTAMAATAAKAASTAAAAAVQGAHQSAGPGQHLPGISGTAPRAGALAVDGVAAEAAAVEVPVAAAAAGAPAAGAAAASGVVPDRAEEPGVVAAADPAADGDRLAPGLLERLGVGPAQVTLLQFSSAFCAPCRAVRRVSSEVAELLAGVQHVEVDAESHLDEVRELNIWRTPTLLILDAEGRVVKRATGVPSKPQLIAAIADVLPATD